jgi:hypothetical protein
LTISALPDSPKPGVIPLHAGMRAPNCGVYRAYHDGHRMPHNIVIQEDTVLPMCKRCRDKVLFVLVSAGEPIAEDRDLGGKPH